jgi:arsenate reductase
MRMMDVSDLVVYEKPTCTTCRKLVKLLNERGVDFERLDYFIDPIPRAKLQELLGKMGMAPRDLLRKREKKYKELGMNNPGLSDEAILEALVEHPELIERPIIERGDRAVLGRPVERVLELL